MKLSTLFFLLSWTTLLNSQTIGTLYERHPIDALLQGECRTKRTLSSEELVLHTRFNTVQFVSLRYLYNAKGTPDPIFFDYYVFREVREGLVLEMKDKTDGLLIATVKKAGVYYGVLNGPDCVRVVRLEAGVAPLVVEAVLYGCCVLGSGLN